MQKSIEEEKIRVYSSELENMIQNEQKRGKILLV
jgi:hypothetical protein